MAKRQKAGQDRSDEAQRARRRTAQAEGPSSAPGPVNLDPASVTPSDILKLQRSAGNRAVNELLQRRDAPDRPVVGRAGGPVSGDLQSQIASAQGGGQRLDRGVSAQIGGKMGADFSAVRVHTDERADHLNRSLSAKAFTLGSNVFFSKGTYSPGTTSGKRLLAHELTHVVQQGAAGTTSPRKTNKVQTKLTVGGADDKFEQEADRVADQVVQSPTTTPPAAGSPPERAAQVQRHGSGHAAPGAAPAVDEGELGLQRAVLPVQQRADPAAVQREVIADWLTESTVPGKVFDYSRGSLLKKIDTAVANFGRLTLPAQRDARVAAADTLFKAVEAWQLSKGDRTSIRHTKILELVAAVTKKIEPDIDFIAKTKASFANFSTLDPDMVPYAKKTPDIKEDRFQPGAVTPGGMLDTLSRPRGDRGALTPETTEAILADRQSELQQNLDVAAKGKLTTEGRLSAEEVRAIMEAHKNKITNSTEFPELENLLAPSTEEDKEKSETRTVGGVSVKVYYNPSDAMFTKRWAMAEAAITRVTAAGFALPALNLYLPKYGRELTVTGTEGHKHEVSIGADSAQAQFVSRNNIYLSSRTYKNPKVETGLSAVLDPSGIATLIHELGHYMHFATSPNKFLQLNFSILAGEVPGGGGERLMTYAQKVVSKYGAQNPREFVAEVFLGLTYNQRFPDFVLKVYKALGGPVPRGQEERFGNLSDASTLPAEAI